MLRNLNRAPNGKRILGTPWVGTLGRDIPQQGDDAPSLLANEASQPEDADALLALEVISSTFPAGKLTVYEDGSYKATALPDGIYSLLYRIKRDGVYSTTDIGLGPGAAVFNLRVGAANDDEPALEARAKWERWLPFVLPLAPNCPRDTAIHHIRQAAIRFCEETHCWNAGLPAILTVARVGDYQPQMPRDATPVKLFTAYLNDAELRCVEMTTGIRADRLGTPGQLPFAYLPGTRGTVSLAPPPGGDGLRLTVSMSFKPAQAAEAVPEELFEQYADHIASGALSTLLRLPKQVWTDPQEATAQGLTFAAHMERVKAQVQAGFARTSKRTRTQWF